MLCRLTGSALDLDEERVLAWREFLLPVLRDGYPGVWEDVGVPNTNLARPLWLFEGDPVPEGTRFVLEHGHEPSGPLIPTEWSDDADCPEAPTCWGYPGPGFDRERHPGAVNAVINAWLVIGVHGRFFETPGTVRRATAATWDTDDDGVEALAWQVDTGSCDPVAAVELLVAALSDLAAVLDEDDEGPVLERIRIG